MTLFSFSLSFSATKSQETRDAGPNIRIYITDHRPVSTTNSSPLPLLVPPAPRPTPTPCKGN